MYGTRLKRGVTLSSTPLLLFIAVFSVLGSVILFQARADTFTTYYVATDGSDTNAGTAAAPWRTIQRSLSRLSSGDTLVVKGGTYTEQIQDPPIRQGTSGGRITVKAAQGERPVLAGLLWLTNADYWTIDGLNVTWNNANTADQYMVKLSNGNGWRLTNSEIWGARSYAAVLVAGEPNEWSIDHNYIHDTYKSNGPNQDHLVYVSGGMGAGTITRNVIANSPNGRGLKIGPQAGGAQAIGDVAVSYNTFYNNTGPSNIQLSYGATNNAIFKNIFVKSGASNVTAYNLNGTGNTVYDNVGWDALGVVAQQEGMTEVRNNSREDPQIDPITYKPGNSKYGDVGRYAAGDETTAGPPYAQDTRANVTGDNTLGAPIDVQAYVRDDMAIGLEWIASNAATGMAGYVVYRSDLPGGTRVGRVTDYIDAGLQPGASYSYQVAAVDTVGNISAKSRPISVTLPSAGVAADTVAPTIRISSPLSGSVVTGPTTVEAAATDNVAVSRVEFRIDAVLLFTDAEAPYQYAWDIHDVVGSHIVEARAIDEAGNTRTASAVVQTGIVNPATGAIMTPTSVTGSNVGTGQINITWKADGADHVDVYRNERLLAVVRNANSYGDSYKLASGKTYSYYVVARDRAGYASDKSETVRVTLARTAGDTGWGSGIITGRVTDAAGLPVSGAVVAVRIDGKTVTAVCNKQGVYSLDGMPADSYQLSVAANGYRMLSDQAIVPSGLFKVKNMTLSK